MLRASAGQKQRLSAPLVVRSFETTHLINCSFLTTISSYKNQARKTFPHQPDDNSCHLSDSEGAIIHTETLHYI